MTLAAFFMPFHCTFMMHSGMQFSALAHLFTAMACLIANTHFSVAWEKYAVYIAFE